jgi:hypothetical protein
MTLWNELLEDLVAVQQAAAGLGQRGDEAGATVAFVQTVLKIAAKAAPGGPVQQGRLDNDDRESVRRAARELVGADEAEFVRDLFQSAHAIWTKKMDRAAGPTAQSLPTGADTGGVAILEDQGNAVAAHEQQALLEARPEQGKEPGTVSIEKEPKGKDGAKEPLPRMLPLREGGDVGGADGYLQLCAIGGLLEVEETRPTFNVLVDLMKGRLQKATGEHYDLLRQWECVREDGTINEVTRLVLKSALLEVGDGYVVRYPERAFADGAELRFAEYLEEEIERVEKDGLKEKDRGRS